ncbi:helix-turn-helix transcriptional regulator [Nocardioides sp. R-C-SC26]|uniref:helix-turn-helix transcriptional regulator n=1 Tax=Nocardioides sp. R-C-SC26 TaxID=2870414 RepID=UPI001E37F907|nr:helix-turn-helix transcriptional regulator [Nocardioides sp. R-C-SC26]
MLAAGPPLIGRDALLAELAALHVAAGGSRALHVRGEPGSGRSRWCAEVAAHARNAGRRVVAVRGIEAERMVDLGVADDVARALGVPVPAGTTSVGLAASIAAALDDEPTTLVIDDLAWVDSASGGVLHRGLRLVTGDVVLATAGDVADPGDPWPRDHRLLTRLTDHQIGLLIERTATAAVRSRALRRLIGWADGSPGVAVELADAVSADGALDDVSRRLGDRQVEALARLGVGARRLLLLVAFAEDRGVARIATAAGVSEAEVRAELAHLPYPVRVVAHDAVHFRSPFVGRSLRAAVGAEEARAVRSALLPTAGPGESLRTRAASVVGADRDVAEELLADADAALARGALPLAAASARVAADVAVGAEQRCRALVVAAEAGIGLGDLTRAAEQLAAAEPATTRQVAEIAMVEFRLVFERDAAAAGAALQRAEAALGRGEGESDLRAELATWESFLAARDFRFGEMPQIMRRARDHAEASGSREHVGLTMAGSAVVTLFAGEPVDLDAVSAVVGELDPSIARHPVVDPAFMLATCHWVRGEFDTAYAISTERTTTSLESGDLAYSAFHVVLAYLAARATGRVVELEPLLDLVERRAREFRHDTADGLSLLLGYVRALDAGDDAAVALLEPSVLEIAVDGTQSQVEMLALFGEAICEGWQLGGRAAQAVALLGVHVERVLGSVVPEPTMQSSVVAGAEAAVLAGEAELARRWFAALGTDPWVERPHLEGSRRRVAALLATDAGDLEAALAHARAAIAMARDAGLVTHHARARWAEGRVHRAARRRREAAEAFADAAALFERAGLAAWRERCADDARRMGTTVSDEDDLGLSPSQRRTAELAASGATNTEIAARLGVSARTVESHLSATYRKLGIRRRSQLASALGTAMP